MNKHGWTYKKLGEVFKTSSGGTPSKSHTEYYEGGKIPWLRSGEVAQGLIYNAELCITDLGLENSSAKIFPIDTVLIAMYGATVGQVGLLKREMATNQAICGIFPNSNFCPLFLLYCLKSKKSHFLKDAVGGAQPNISQNLIKNTLIPIPPLVEQERIVEELDLLSGIIEKKKEQLKAYDQLAQSIFYDMFGDPIDNPKGWEVKKLGEVCHSITDGDHMPPPKSDKGIPFLTISNVNKDKQELDFSNTFFVPQEYYDNLKDERKARINDLLYTVTGSYGIPVIVKTSRPFCFQRHIALLRPIQEKVLTSFLFNWALCPSIKEEADNVATGIAQKTVGLNSLRQFSVILPPLSLQQEFAEKVEAIERQKALVQQSIVETQTLFDSRMAYWFD